MTIVKDLKGMVFTSDAMGERDITVRFTSDKHGESISLEFKGIMFLVPFEPVKEIIKQARNRKEDLIKQKKRELNSRATQKGSPSNQWINYIICHL